MNNKHIKDSFEKFTPTQFQKEKMYSEILSKKKDCNVKSMKKRHFCTVLIAAAICVCFAVSALAVSSGLDKGFFTFLSPTSEQADYLANGAYVVNKKVSNKNGILEVKQVIGDENNLYILMDFTAPSGTVLDAARYQFEPFKTDFEVKDHNSAHTWDFKLLDDEDPSDNKISLIMYVGSEYSAEGKKFSMSLVDLQAAGPFPSEFETVVKGKWKMSFPLNYKNTSASYEINEPISLYGEALTLERISISPISINLYMTGEKLEEVLNNSREKGETFDEIPVTLVFEDGTNFTTGDENSEFWQIGHCSDMNLSSTKAFHKVIDNTKVASVIIFNQEFDLK